MGLFLCFGKQGLLAIGIMLAAGPFYTGRDDILRAFQTPGQQAVIVVLHHDGGISRVD